MQLTSGNHMEEARLGHAADAVLGPALERPVVLVGAGDEPHDAAAVCKGEQARGFRSGYGNGNGSTGRVKWLRKTPRKNSISYSL